MSPNQTSTSVAKYSVGAATEWMEYSGMRLADVMNEDDTPGTKLGAIGFTVAPKGASSEFTFAYDEVLVVTKGKCTVTSDGKSHTAAAGEAIYLPAQVPGIFKADEDTELVYVASSPYGEVNREAKADLLAK